MNPSLALTYEKSKLQKIVPEFRQKKFGVKNKRINYFGNNLNFHKSRSYAYLTIYWWTMLLRVLIGPNSFPVPISAHIVPC